MAFLDSLKKTVQQVGEKASDAASKAKDAASDAVETTKLKSKIHDENKAIDEAIAKIGRIYVDLADKGGVRLEGGAQALFEEIIAHRSVIDEARKAIEALKEEAPPEKAKAAAGQSGAKIGATVESAAGKTEALGEKIEDKAEALGEKAESAAAGIKDRIE